MAPRNHSTTPPSEASAYDKRERSPTNIPVGNSRVTRGSALTTPPSSAPPSTVTHADERAARLSSSVPGRAATRLVCSILSRARKLFPIRSAAVCA